MELAFGFWGSKTLMSAVALGMLERDDAPRRLVLEKLVVWNGLPDIRNCSGNYSKASTALPTFAVKSANLGSHL